MFSNGELGWGTRRGQSSRADAQCVVIGQCMGGKATPFGNIT